MGLMGSCVLRLARKHMAEEDAAEAAALDAGRANAKELTLFALQLHVKTNMKSKVPSPKFVNPPAY
eukprot:2803873-Amphidinium_carterae.1